MKSHSERLRTALLKAYDLGYEHGKPKSGFTGRKLASILMEQPCRIGDQAFLRKAYSAGIWAKEIEEKY